MGDDSEGYIRERTSLREMKVKTSERERERERERECVGEDVRPEEERGEN